MGKVYFNNILNFDVNTPCTSQLLEQRIKDSSITKLRPDHLPDESMCLKISQLLDLFSRSDSIKDTINLRLNIITELNHMHDEILALREHIFYITNKHTDRVYGMLKSGFTVNDRDQYIKKLMSYHQSEIKIVNVTDKEHGGYFSISAPNYHRSSPLSGDLAALECLLAGRHANVPNLIYNFGSCQYD